jgi:hypothetical protein
MPSFRELAVSPSAVSDLKLCRAKVSGRAPTQYGGPRIAELRKGGIRGTPFRASPPLHASASPLSAFKEQPYTPDSRGCPNRRQGRG